MPDAGASQVAANWTAFASTAHTASIDITATGGAGSQGLVWTGTNYDGSASGDNCSNWTTTSGSGDAGAITDITSGLWSNEVPDFPATACSASLPLYCVQQ